MQSQNFWANDALYLEFNHNKATFTNGRGILYELGNIPKSWGFLSIKDGVCWTIALPSDFLLLAIEPIHCVVK
jgi:hypothetical protein